MRGAISKDGSDVSSAGVNSGGQDVHREAESEGHEEKYRAVIDGAYPEDEAVGQKVGQGRACTMESEGVLIHPPHQGVCGRQGMEEQRVTSAGLTESPRGTRSKRTYKRKRNGERGSVSSWAAEQYLKGDESCVTE